MSYRILIYNEHTPQFSNMESMSNQFWALNPTHKHELFYAPKCDNATSTYAEPTTRFELKISNLTSLCLPIPWFYNNVSSTHQFKMIVYFSRTS